MQKKNKLSHEASRDGSPRLTRRQFLGLTAVGLGTAAVAAIPLSKDPVYGADFPHVPENYARLPPNGKSVCILGGGLAGIQAGVELAARGFKVTVLEKSGYPGGKLKTWRDKTFGPDDHPLKKDPAFRGVVREHGAHGIWGGYKNLREFMGRYGYKTESVYPHSMDYLFWDKNGKKIRFTDSELPPPYDRIPQILSLFSIEHAKNTREVWTLLNGIVKMISFDPHNAEQTQYLDSITFADYAKKIAIPDHFTQTFFAALAHMVYYDTVENISALAMVLAIKMSSAYPDDAKISLYANPPGETFLQPMVDFIKQHGGRVLYNHDVGQIATDGLHITEVRTLPVPQTVRVRRCQVCGELIYGDDNHDHCPFCGADAPQLKDLEAPERQEQTHHADYYILAMDVPGLQRIVANNTSTLGGQKYFQNILRMTSRPVWVVDYWIPATGFWEKRFESRGDPLYTFTPTGTDRCGVTFNWTMPKPDEFGNPSTLISDYADHNVTIIECHVAHIEKLGSLTNAELAQQIFSELKSMVPEIPDYLDYYVNRWNNYTGARVGERRLRPDIQSPIDNLLIIGDLAKFHGIELGMEKTNVTAKLATNILLDKIGQRQGRITILECGTPSAITDVYQKMTSVYPE